MGSVVHLILSPAESHLDFWVPTVRSAMHSPEQMLEYHLYTSTQESFGQQERAPP